MNYFFKGTETKAALLGYLDGQQGLIEMLSKPKEEPSTEALLHLKDRLFITDKNWKYIVKTFSLRSGKLCTIKEYRTAINKKAKVTKTANGKGTTRSIETILTELFTKDPPTSNTVKIKFAFDGCRVSKVCLK